MMTLQKIIIMPELSEADRDDYKVIHCLYMYDNVISN